ncbi:MAG: hypothetical protein EPN70_09650 [Paraburkholderia sp.]|uniref:hypothetical protein n=1 Tax=Paraburkholderia sp. TaxID=1926495 RepID=UPI0012207BA0|nr:hypothetical protein [Paraburkholderia sp.]TAM05066.1 MAG: hypothetical protein EPN70_09650 [Paraburkholderia sp.]
MQSLQMQTLQRYEVATPVAKAFPHTPCRVAPRVITVQMIVRVATSEAESARRALHRMLGSALGVHTVDIDRRHDLACLHVELDRARVGEAMALLIRTVSRAEFGAIRRLERI